jgi:hypothetical protein
MNGEGEQIQKLARTFSKKKSPLSKDQEKIPPLKKPQ